MAILLLTLVSLPACHRSTTGPDAAPRADTQSKRPAQADADPGGFPVTIDDSLGRAVTVSKRPQRIVSLAPTHTEILFAVGAGDRVVGVTSHCNFPSEASRRQHVGGFAPETMSIETIVGLQPDLVLSAGLLHRRVIDALAPLGTPVAGLDAARLDDVYRNVEIVGRLTGCREQGRKLAADLRNRVEQVKLRLQHVPRSDRPNVFYLVWDQPLMTVGAQSYINEVVESAGGRNIFDDVAFDYPQVSDEEVIARNPDIILAAASGEMEVRRRAIVERPGWQQLPAVRRQRIHFVDADRVSRPGPRLVEMVEVVARILHPEAFNEPAREAKASVGQSTKGSENR
jgi:iron complex transport system substrate-binding protein